jgi:hypothetical protein
MTMQHGSDAIGPPATHRIYHPGACDSRAIWPDTEVLHSMFARSDCVTLIAGKDGQDNSLRKDIFIKH